MADGLLRFGITFVLAWVSAGVFLALRCRREGRPFGPSSRWWALAAVGLTSTTSTSAAFAGVAVLRFLPPSVPSIVLGVVAPSGLLLGNIQRQRPEHRQGRLQEVPTLWLALLLERIDQAMADDRVAWCEARIDQRWRLDQLLAAARHYHAAVKERLPPAERPRARLDARLRAIEDRLDVVGLIQNGASATKVHSALRTARVTGQKRHDRYRNDLGRLANLLTHEAEQELLRLLAVAYRYRFYRLKSFSGATAGKPSEGPGGDMGPHP